MKTYIFPLGAATLTLLRLPQGSLAHPGFAYSETPVKGPCPAIKTLANHGLLPRDGKNMPTADIVSNLQAIFGVSSLGVIFEALSGILRIDENGVEVVNMDDLWVGDIDASFTHQDAFFDPTYAMDDDLLAGLEAAAGDDGILTWEEVADWRDIRLEDSYLRNPKVAFTGNGIRSLAFNSAMLFAAFGSDPTFATVPVSNVLSFLRDNRFPNGFVPRVDRGEAIRSFVNDDFLRSMQGYFTMRIMDKLPPQYYTASQTPTREDCIQALTFLQFDPFDYDQYPYYFKDDSKMILAEAGEYIGPAAIEEYVRFADDNSPYIEEQDVLAFQMKFKDLDQSEGLCRALVYRVNHSKYGGPAKKDAEMLSGVMLQIEYDYNEKYIKEVNIYFPPGNLEVYMGDILDTDDVRDYICDVSQSEGCSGVNEGMSHAECVAKLERLPTFSHDRHFDGNDLGCRILHAVFAEENPDHCAHISFDPMEDPKGQIKCQESKGMHPLDMFDAKDIEDFHDFLDDESKSYIGDIKGYKILNMPKDVNRVRLILLGLMAPVLIVIMGLVLLPADDAAPNDEEGDKTTCTEDRRLDEPVNKLLANKARQLWTLIFVVLTSLIIIQGMVAMLVWWLSEKKDWDSFEYPEYPLRDRYRGEPNRVAETAPHYQMSDEQFQVYTGFVVYVTTLFTGLGMEVFVWYHFLQAWSPDRELMWRFAQFIFPMMILLAIGLVMHQNYLGMFFAVVGLFKLGFPETLMYLYLGLFAKHNTPLVRLTDIINGIATVLHHSAAITVLSMQVVGVIPPVRYAINGSLILAMQHWMILLSYGNVKYYTVIILVMEYYFEWNIFSDFAEIYHLHWAAAYGTGSMVLAHWLYFAAGFLGMFSGSTGHGDADSNVYVRGNDKMRRRSTVAAIRRRSTVTEPHSIETANETMASRRVSGRRKSSAIGLRAPTSGALRLVDEFLAEQSEELHEYNVPSEFSQAILGPTAEEEEEIDAEQSSTAEDTEDL